ncbi:MAG: ImmA/IrrE family metallo-endopeptidase, partial [Pseudomonadota bacterium]
IDDFIVCHEIAHGILEHNSDTLTSDTIETEADRLAIEIMLSESWKGQVHEGQQQFEAPEKPLIGYLCLNLWGMLREVSEWRASAFLADTPKKMSEIRQNSQRLQDTRLKRMLDVPNFAKSEPSQHAKATLRAGMRLHGRLVALEIDEQRAQDVVRLARTLAKRDYSMLRREVLEATEKYKKEREGKSN